MSVSWLGPVVGAERRICIGRRLVALLRVAAGNHAWLTVVTTLNGYLPQVPGEVTGMATSLKAIPNKPVALNAGVAEFCIPRVGQTLRHLRRPSGDT